MLLLHFGLGLDLTDLKERATDVTVPIFNSIFQFFLSFEFDLAYYQVFDGG